jgi:A118 family predicted phage portal protein
MFTRLLEWIRKVFEKMIGQSSIKQALKVDIAISAPMANALQTWAALYRNQAEWLNKDIKSINLPATIAGEIARAVTVEMKATIQGSPRADYLNAQLAKILPKLRQQVEYGVAKGGLVFKPFVDNSEIDVDFVQADQFYPVAFDSNGNITACFFADQRTIGQYVFTRLEYHALEGTDYIIRNQAFRSSSQSELGQPTNLTSVPAWAELTPEATITHVPKPLFAYFRFPAANNIDTSSPLGVSCYSRVVELIEQADRQWSDLLWEFESGQRALYADVVAFKNENGKSVLPLKRLYRALNGTSNIGDNPDGLYHDWSPTFRETNILNGLDAILRRIEFNVGLAYGTLSNPQSVDKTATELKISNQRSYVTITDTQNALRVTLENLLYAMDFWVTLYKLAPKGAYTATFDFDDSVITDKEAQFSQDSRAVGMGVMGKVEFRMRNYGEDEATAKAKIAAVQAEQPQESDLFKGA